MKGVLKTAPVAEIDCSWTPNGGFHAFLYLECGHRVSIFRGRRQIREHGDYVTLRFQGRERSADAWLGGRVRCPECRPTTKRVGKYIDCPRGGGKTGCAACFGDGFAPPDVVRRHYG